MKKSVCLMAPLTLLLAHEALAQDDGPIEEIITTGTRIVRTDQFAEAGHVIGMDEVSIDALAELNISDVLRSSPLNSHGSFHERSGNTAQSNAFIDLRGLGAHRTLVIVDGMRMPGSPNFAAAAVNINMLPTVAVKRVDILADGASAVYGSDAMAGVANVVLHRDFEGVEISMRYGDRARDDGGDKSFGFLAGASGDRGNVVVALEYSHRDPVFDRDRHFTQSTYGDLDGDGRVDLNIETSGVSFYGRTWELFDPTTGYYELRPAADCPTTDGFIGAVHFALFGLPDDSGCGYAFADISANRAELEKVNGYMYANYDLGERAQLYTRVMMTKNDSFGRYAPPAAPWPDPPADHPHNPFDSR